MNMYAIKSFIEFYLKANTRYNVQSDFLHDFVNTVLDTDKEYYIFRQLEGIRAWLKQSNQTIPIRDFGAGSHKLTDNNRKVAAIVSTSLSRPDKCRMLFLLAEHYHCMHILELGTSLGISSAYLGAASSKAKVTTLEGDPILASIAHEVHTQANLKNIHILTGPFSETLPGYLSDCKTIDLAFIDGHHQKEATLRYFEQIKLKCNNDSIIVLDDIYWSKGMTEAWQTICANSDVTLSIDLFHIGIVFFKKELSKQYFPYLPYLYKPWKIGLFS